MHTPTIKHERYAWLVTNITSYIVLTIENSTRRARKVYRFGLKHVRCTTAADGEKSDKAALVAIKDSGHVNAFWIEKLEPFYSQT